MKYLLVLLCSLTCYLSANTESYFVGELGPSWEFPSDHLPIGMSLDDFHIASWNILNRDYLGHIAENGQGLRDSAIMRDNVPAESDPTLTVRETVALRHILEMLNNPTAPRSMIALEETHATVQAALVNTLPPHWQIALPPGQEQSQDLFLYDTTRFELVSIEAEKYAEDKPKTIFSMTLTEKTTGKTYRFIQSHIPGGPENSPAACAKFAEVVMKQFDPSMTIVLMGDMNQSPSVIEQALKLAAENSGFAQQPFHYLENPNPTHINTKMEAAWIDLFFFYTPEASPQIKPALSSELLDALAPITNLLKELKSS